LSLSSDPFRNRFRPAMRDRYTDDGREWTHARSPARTHITLHRPPNDQWRRPWVSPRGRWPPTRTTIPAYSGCCVSLSTHPTTRPLEKNTTGNVRQPPARGPIYFRFYFLPITRKKISFPQNAVQRISIAGNKITFPIILSFLIVTTLPLKCLAHSHSTPSHPPKLLRYTTNSIILFIIITNYNNLYRYVLIRIYIIYKIKLYRYCASNKI